MKNRYGLADQVIGTAFYGEIGWFKELPLGKDIYDCSIYHDIHNNINLQDAAVKDTVVGDSKPMYKFN